MNNWKKVKLGDFANNASPPSIRGSEVFATKVKLPPLPEQRKVAEILSCWDRAIEKTEELQKALGHCENNLARLFFGNNNGSIAFLGEHAIKVGSGSTPKGGYRVYKETGIPFIRSQNVHSTGFSFEGLTFISENQHARVAGTHLSSNDVLLNITNASIGRCCIVPSELEKGNVNQHVCIIRCKETMHPEYLQFYLSSIYGQNQINSLQAGGNRQGLNFHQVRRLKIPVKPIDEQRKIVSIVRCHKKISFCENKKQVLCQDYSHKASRGVIE